MNPSPAAPECWLLALAQSDETITRLSEFLSREEMARATAFSTARLRSQWIVARAGLRLLLARSLGLSASELKLSQTEFGKPILSDDPGLLHFNLSHTESHAAYVLSRNVPVGVDLEPLDRSQELLCCREAFCHPDESQLATSDANLIRLWCAKEAALKAAGLGFQIEPNQIQVTGWEMPPVQAILPGHSPWEIVFPKIPEVSGLCLAVAFPPGSVAPAVKHWDWDGMGLQGPVAAGL